MASASLLLNIIPQRTWPLAGLVLLALGACRTPEPAPPTPKSLLLTDGGSKTWALAQQYRNGLPLPVPTCTQDDRYTFRRTKAFFFDSGALPCQTPQQESYTANWYFNDVETQLILDPGEAPADTFLLVNLADEELELLRRQPDTLGTTRYTRSIYRPAE